MIRANEAGHRVTLTRRDVIVFEQRLKDAIGGIFPFRGHSIHFPRTLDDTSATWISREKKLLLPLPDGQGSILGVFVARGVHPGLVPSLMPHWATIGKLISDNLLLYKRSLCDPVTGLFSRHYLLSSMEREIETLRDPIRTAPPSPGIATDPAAGTIARDAVRGSADGLFAGGNEVPRRACLGTLVVRLAALRDVVREFGYQFADELMVALADALTDICPEQALAARTGDSEFAVHLPAASPKACRKLAGEIAETLRGVFVVHPLRRERVGIVASVGYTLYPQDMAGNLFVRPSSEQARLVLRKARLAAALADENGLTHADRVDNEQVMGFGRILAEGGRVLETLPLSRVMVSLGASMHAREGQRFSVWSVQYPVQGQYGAGDGNKNTCQSHGPLTPLYKGELVLMEVHENTSQAEIIHIGDPTWNIEPGDTLVLLPEEQGSLARGREGEVRHDPATGLLRHGDFFARWSEERDRTDSFALALVRLAPKNPGQEVPAPTVDAAGAADIPVATAEQLQPGKKKTKSAAAKKAVQRITAAEGTVGEESGKSVEAPTPGAGADVSPCIAPDADSNAVSATTLDTLDDDFNDAPSDNSLHAGQFMTEAVQLCLEELGVKVLGGRYGLNSLIFFHPDMDAKAATALYENLARTLESRLGLEVAVGIAVHPFLDFRKTDALESCQKALEYAMLLPRPHVGVLDSLALNISADKRFSKGDTFGAIKEYQTALLADENNGMAWNSLGICLAGLGRHAEAERHFSKALASNPNDAMALYNLGYMHQSQGQEPQARQRFWECLTQEPDHLYAMVRLGQLAESAGSMKVAREFYEKAAILPGGESLTFRHFARLCISEGKLDEAREHLHEALLHDPQDALAMQFLARLYLDAGEDPDMAASLARQSVSLRPGLKSGWLQLARALEAMGKDKEAKEARLKAGEV